jgi:hypothetical protein
MNNKSNSSTPTIVILGMAALASLLVASAFVTTLGTAVFADTCIPTGFWRDNIPMTAKSVVLVGPATISGEVDATGCNIGVYFAPGTTGTVNDANIHGANYFGVVVHRASVNITDSEIHDIGETPFNGAQHGLAVYYATVDSGSAVAQPACTSGSTTGTVDSNTIWDYQKGGIIVNCEGSSVIVTNNSVTGLDKVNFIAQNGIQFGFGAQGEARGNEISNNFYTGCSNQDAAKTGCTPFVSAGLLMFDILANEVKHSMNTYRDNQFNVLLVNSQSLM